MRLKRRVLQFTIGTLALALLASSVMSIRGFRDHYTNALISGGYGLAYAIGSRLNDLLAPGQPLQSVSGMDRILAEVVEKNGLITYACVMNSQGKVLFHSQPDQVGRIVDQAGGLRALQANKPGWQSYQNNNGRQFIDVDLPLFNGEQRSGVIRLGFAASVIEDKVMEAIMQLLVNVILSFVLIILLLNFIFRGQAVGPIKRLCEYAQSIAQGVACQTVRFNRSDEIGLLSGALVRMSTILRKRTEALKRAGQWLEEKVNTRTRHLVRTNSILESSNSDLKQVLQRECELSEALRSSEERFRMLFEQSKAVMLLIDPEDGRIVSANKVAVDYYGYTHDHLLKLSISHINNLSSYEIACEMKLAQQEERNHFYFRHTLASGEVRDVEVHSGPIKWDDRSLLYSIIHDITDRKKAEQELQYIAHYDALTGLPNRLLKDDRLQQALIHSHRNETCVAVCYLDLDGFKPINDEYGHDIGDRILIETACRLQTMVREGDTVSRVGGDEFVLILTELSGLEQCRLILDRLLLVVAQPIAIDDLVVEVCASIGLTLYPQDDAEADILLRHADQAMYMAKENGKNRYHLFDPVEGRQIRMHREKRQRLRQALSEQELELYYQPKVNMLTCEVIGMEALIRWNHPEKGLLLPGEFLHFLSNKELEIELGNWVIRRALEQQMALRESGLAIPVSVNISAHHLQDAGFMDTIRGLLAELPLRQAGDLEFEILESASFEDMTDIFHTLVVCRELGIHFSLDDFGTGYSSLAYFHRLPVDSLKIDQTFVQDMLEDPKDLAIIDSVVRLAKAFKQPVIAEGVESLEHGAALLRLGCSLGQGYGIARPMPFGELIAWKRRWDQDLEWRELKHRLEWNEEVDIQAAIASHQQWSEGLIEMLREADSARRVQLDSRHCALGRWLQRVGYLHYGHLPVYDEIRQYHEQVHTLGRELYELAYNGFRQEALERMPELEAMRDNFIAQIGQLQEVESSAHHFQRKVFQG